MRYYITSHMKNGDKWVTIRDSFEEMNSNWSESEVAD